MSASLLTRGLTSGAIGLLSDGLLDDDLAIFDPVGVGVVDVSFVGTKAIVLISSTVAEIRLFSTTVVPSLNVAIAVPLYSKATATMLNPVFSMKKDDTLPVFRVTLKESINRSSPIPVNLTGASIKLRYAIATNPTVTVERDMTIIDAIAGDVAYHWQQADTTVPGRYIAQIRVTLGDGNIRTFPSSGNIEFVIDQTL